MIISLRDCLIEMDKKDPNGKPIPFSIEFWTADRKKKTGGELLSLEICTVSRNHKKEQAIAVDAIANPDSKKQNHWVNSTRNLMIHPSGQIRKCHIRLIEKLNGKKIYW